jgi:hypothetical protein
MLARNLRAAGLAVAMPSPPSGRLPQRWRVPVHACKKPANMGRLA